jgi:hypothetical protein
MNLYDVLSDTMVTRLLDENYPDNGNWIPAINGTILPGCVRVEDVPVVPGRRPIQTDSRKAPDAELRSFGADNFMLRLHFASDQPDILAEAMGMGSEILDQADTNTANTVGNYVAAAPASVTDALFGMFLTTGAGAAWDVLVPPNTLPHSDYEVKIYIWAYNHVTDTFDLAVHALNTWLDRFTGNLRIDNAVLTASHRFTYDAAESGIVTVGGQSVGVDFKDPTLDNGDEAVILSFSYQYAQLPSARDYSLTQPVEKPSRVVIDLFRSLTDSIEGPIWQRRRYWDCRQQNIPAKSTDGSNENANETAYEFVVRRNHARLGGNHKYYSDEWLLEALSAS